MLSYSCVKAAARSKNYVAPHERGLSEAALLALLKRNLGSNEYKRVLKAEKNNGKSPEDARELAKAAMRVKKASVSLDDIRA
jgi:hypothetical protein